MSSDSQNKKKQLYVRVLGCGGSGGVPYANGYWGACDPDNPKNRRLRPSIFLRYGDTQIIVDTTPDFRQQVLSIPGWNGHLDAVLYTHAHADHIQGIDDLRSIMHQKQAPVDIYGDERTLQKIEKHFDYIFKARMDDYPPMVTPHALDEKNKSFEINGLKIEWFWQYHGQVWSAGFRIGDFAYCTDVKTFPEESYDKLHGLKYWIVDGLNKENTHQHASIGEVQEWVQDLSPDMTYLTHMTDLNDYDTMCRTLPDHIRPAYDGLEFYVDI